MAFRSLSPGPYVLSLRFMHASLHDVSRATLHLRELGADQRPAETDLRTVPTQRGVGVGVGVAQWTGRGEGLTDRQNNHVVFAFSCTTTRAA